MSKSRAQTAQEVHEARMAQIRREHTERITADRVRHQEVMAAINAKLTVMEQRNLEWLIAWLEQKATPEQIVNIISKINQGEV
jgi:hypothetical protein